MVHTIYLDDAYADVRKLLKEIRRYKQGVTFDVDSVVTEGYITSDEFRKRAMEKVNSFCDKHGIL